ncbi:MAG: tetrahydrofolate synthase, partial [Spirochaetaceae bacterium]|nr:tetrahydrofolate synthase [Spirochaetaceae bacterium]
MSERAFTTPKDVFDWLGRFVNLEQGVKPPSMRPERMRVIAEAAGHPENCAPAVHIAGSKGKGSTAAFVSAILTAGGLRTARYLSPHVAEYRERITQDGVFFDDAVYADAGGELRSIEKKITNPRSQWYKALEEISGSGAGAPTFFELLTLYYFLCAQKAGCKTLSVETGMGGRLDPTNICKSRAVIITEIELEHTDMLGETIEEIAFEKAGIIKEGIPVIVGTQAHKDGAAALDIFRKTAREKRAPLFYFPEVASMEALRCNKDGCAWTLAAKTGDFFPGPVDLEIALCGEVQALNASVAALAVRAAFPGIPQDVIREGVRNVRLPARFERISRAPEVVVDGAHTQISISLCVKEWKRLYGEGGVLIFGCAAGKDVEAMARVLTPEFSKIIITTPGSYKISEPEKIFEAFNKAA